MTGLICCTMDCNLACEYCFEGNGYKKNMPDIKNINEVFIKNTQLINKFINELYQWNLGKNTTIIWHGGEPTLIRSDVLEKIMQEHENQKIRWAIQTNGTLLTNKYIDIFKKYNVNVGISLDGLKKHHDKYRVMKNGKPTFDLIMKNIRLLQAEKVIVNVLLTITNQNVNDLIEIYKFCAAYKLNINFNALYPTSHKCIVDLNENEYTDKICELFDYWIQDYKNRIIIVPFLKIIEGIMYPNVGISVCHWRKNCSKSMIAIDMEGDLYNCEHWIGEKEFCIGNIRNGLERTIKSKNTLFADRIEHLEKQECYGCEIYKLCYGGCPWNATELFGNENRKDASICEGRKKIIRHIYEYMKNTTKQKIPDKNTWKIGGEI